MINPRRWWHRLSAPSARYAVIILFLAGIGTTAGAYALSVSAIHRAERATASTMQLCQAGNEARAEQLGLWQYIIHLSKPPPTAQGRAVLAKFEHHLDAVFAPRNCAHPSRTEPTP